MLRLICASIQSSVCSGNPAVPAVFHRGLSELPLRSKLDPGDPLASRRMSVPIFLRKPIIKGLGVRTPCRISGSTHDVNLSCEACIGPLGIHDICHFNSRDIGYCQFFRYFQGY